MSIREMQDLLLTWRTLRRSPGFTAIAVLTLAAAIFGVAAMFALLDGVLLRRPAGYDPQRVVTIWRTNPASAAVRWPFEPSTVVLLRDGSRRLERVAGIGYQDPLEVVAKEGAAVFTLRITRVSGDFFGVLRARPHAGRMLTESDDREGSERVIVLAHRFWLTHYGGAPEAIGARIRINDRPFTIVGVMHPDVEYPHRADGWVSARALASTIGDPTFSAAAVNELGIVARLRGDATAGQIEQEVRAIAPSIETDVASGGPQTIAATVEPLDATIVARTRPALLAAFGAVALVLLIAIANVATLLLIRREARSSETAIRMAIGAGRWRLVRLALVEGVIVGTLAGILAAAVLPLCLPWLLRLLPDAVPRLNVVRADGRVLLFLAAATAVSAFAAAGPGALLVASSTARRYTLAGVSRHVVPAGRARTALVACQLTVALVVIVTAGLLARSLAGLYAEGRAHGSGRLIHVALDMPQEKYGDRTQRLQFLERAVESVRGISGVESVTPITVRPFTGTGWGVPVFMAEHQSIDRARANPSLDFEAVHPAHFRTFDLEILAGRAFTPGDRQDAPLVAILTDDVAAVTWPGESPIGKRIRIGPADSKDPWRTVVGVVRAAGYRDLTIRRPTLYVPAEQLIVTAGALVVRSDRAPAVLAPALRDRIGAIDPEVSVLRVESFQDLLEPVVARPRFLTAVAAAYGAAALVLSILGLYGTTAAFVRLRERDIGVRLAVGASAANVRRLVLAQGLRMAAVGTVLGVVTMLAAGQMLRGLLFRVPPHDALTLGGAALVLCGACLLACVIPARRAARIDPAALLRAE